MLPQRSVAVKSAILFWNVTSCTAVEVYWPSKTLKSLHLTTRLHTLESNFVHSHSCKNLKPEVYLCVHNSRPLNYILSQLNPVHTLILSSYPRLRVFPTTYCVHFSPLYEQCMFLLGLEYGLWMTLITPILRYIQDEETNSERSCRETDLKR